MYNVQMYSCHLSELPVFLSEELHPGPELPVHLDPGLLRPASARPALKVGHGSLNAENKSFKNLYNLKDIYNVLCIITVDIAYVTDVKP